MASETHETSSAQPEMKDVEKGVEGGLASEAAVPPAPSPEEANADMKPDNLSSSSGDDIPAEKPVENPLQKQESQADKMSKTRIFAIMLSLCVCSMRRCVAH